MKSAENTAKLGILGDPRLGYKIGLRFKYENDILPLWEVLARELRDFG